MTRVIASCSVAGKYCQTMLCTSTWTRSARNAPPKCSLTACDADLRSTRQGAPTAMSSAAVVRWRRSA
jgi:hypothetical protein